MLATSLAQGKVESAVDVAVLKKSIELQEQTATHLLQSLPDGVGTQINTTA
nr:YjfB family protein [Thiocystis violacea]